MVEISDLIQELKWYRNSTIPELQPEYIDEIVDLLEFHRPHVLSVNEIKAHECAEGGRTVDGINVTLCLDNLRKRLEECGDQLDAYVVGEAISILKLQEPMEPHYTTLKYIVDGKEVSIQHPECPRCYENGLILYDAEIGRGELFCKRCGQKVKWT